MSDNNYSNALEHEIFSYITKAADHLKVDTYVIGGFVRDFFLKRQNKMDIDIVCVGDGIALAKEVASLLPNKPKGTSF